MEAKETKKNQPIRDILCKLGLHFYNWELKRVERTYTYYNCYEVNKSQVERMGTCTNCEYTVFKKV